MATSLAAARAAGWTGRVPTLVLTLGTSVTCGVLVAIATAAPGSGGTRTIEEATSWSSFVGILVLGVAFGAVLTSWWAPRLSAWVMTVTLGLPVAVEVAPARVVVLAWGVVLVADLLLLLRQREIAGWSWPAPSGGAPQVVPRHGVARATVAAVLAVAMAGAFAAYLGWRSDARALAERAVLTPSEVVASDSAVDHVEVELDGERIKLFVEDARDHPVGSTLDVYVDPSGRMPPYSSEDADPDGWSLLGAPIAAAGWCVVLLTSGFGRRRRRLDELVASRGPGLPGLVREHPVTDGLEVFALDDPDGRRPLMLLPIVRALSAPGADPVASDEDDDLDDWSVDDTVEVELVGLRGDGSWCVVRRVVGGEPHLWVSVRPARDRWTLLTVLHAGRRRIARRLEPLAALAPRRRGPAGPGRLARTAGRIGRDLAVPGVLLLAASAFLVVPWTQEGEGPGFHDLVAAFGVGGLAHAWAGSARSLVRLGPWGLVLAGGLVDELVHPDRVSAVTWSSEALRIQLGDDGVRVVEPPEHWDAADRLALLEEVERTLDRGRDRAGEIRPLLPGLPHRWPSLPLLAGLGVGLCWLVAAFW